VAGDQLSVASQGRVARIFDLTGHLTTPAPNCRRLLQITFGELEVVNAMGLRVFRREVSPAQAESALSEFEKDLRDGVFQLRGLTDPILERAQQLSRQTAGKLGTRTADLLHVAAALELGVDCIYSFDLHQRKLAQTLRLKLN